MHDPALEAAFRATCYRVETPDGTFDLRIGEKHRGFAGWLERQGIAHWFVLTACNPGARILPSEMNAARMAALRAKIEASGHVCYRARNRSDTRDWPDEAAFLLRDVDESTVRAWAADYGQLAFVAGRGDGVAWLEWV